MFNCIIRLGKKGVRDPGVKAAASFCSASLRCASLHFDGSFDTPYTAKENHLHKHFNTPGGITITAIKKMSESHFHQNKD
jgi:pyrroline-5-carboxylate reductase